MGALNDSTAIVFSSNSFSRELQLGQLTSPGYDAYPIDPRSLLHRLRSPRQQAPVYGNLCLLAFAPHSSRPYQSRSTSALFRSSDSIHSHPAAYPGLSEVVPAMRVAGDQRVFRYSQRILAPGPLHMNTPDTGYAPAPPLGLLAPWPQHRLAELRYLSALNQLSQWPMFGMQRHQWGVTGYENVFRCFSSTGQSSQVQLSRSSDHGEGIQTSIQTVSKSQPAITEGKSIEPQNEDCLGCRLIGSAAGILSGTYVLMQESKLRRQPQNLGSLKAKRPLHHSFGSRMMQVIGFGFIGLGVARAIS